MGEEIWECLQLLLALKGVTLVFLPAYSPELNPCELANNMIKTHTRYHSQTRCLWFEIAVGLSKIDYLKVWSFYTHSRLAAFQG